MYLFIFKRKTYNVQNTRIVGRAAGKLNKLIEKVTRFRIAVVYVVVVVVGQEVINEFELASIYTAQTSQVVGKL